MPSLGSTKRRQAEKTSHHQSIERLRQDTRKSVWYAFDTLANPTTSNVAKSQLKVLTSTIGMVLGFDKAEEILNKDMSTNELGFYEYLELLDTEIFDKLTSSSMESMNLSNEDLEAVHKNCYLLFLKLKKDPKGSLGHLNSLPEDVSHHLWRVFNFLAEEKENCVPVLPLQLDLEEAELLLNCFVERTGHVALLPEIQTFLSGISDGALLFQQLELAIVNIFSKNVNDLAVKTAVKELFQKFIGDTLMKGMLCKCGYGVKSWKDRWMILTPKELTYYTSSAEKEKKGSIPIDSTCKVEIAQEKAGSKPNRFILRTTAKPYEMSAPDVKTRTDWMTALQKAIDKSQDEGFHFHRHELMQRREKRRAKKEQIQENEKKKQEEADMLQRMREEYDKKIREDQERFMEHQRALEEAKLAQAELEERLRKEEALRKELEGLLELERQAKRDEEIVRALQARILEEEYEKREELEKLKAEEEALLKRERAKREVLEEEKHEQNQKLLEAEARLKQLETERENADLQLQESSEKLKAAEKERLIMEEKLKLWKQPTGLARPILPKANPHVTHRGLGAFSKDFLTQTSRNESEQTLINGESLKATDIVQTSASIPLLEKDVTLNESEKDMTDSESMHAKDRRVSEEEETTKDNVITSNDENIVSSVDELSIS